ncbi:MAG: hypothetical protein QOI54_1825 [Actinomycetota bacterium]|jgi:hypothetical protein|nr:hypothetical protein [Actinomycetota bacterium]
MVADGTVGVLTSALSGLLPDLTDIAVVGLGIGVITFGLKVGWAYVRHLIDEENRLGR